MTPDRKKPTAGFWITVALLAVLVGYPLSCGPVAYFVGSNSDSIPEWANVILEWYFLPLEWVKNHGPEWLNRAIEKYEIFWDGL